MIGNCVPLRPAVRSGLLRRKSDEVGSGNLIQQSGDSFEMCGDGAARRQTPNPPIFLLAAIALMVGLHALEPVLILAPPNVRWAAAVLIGTGMMMNIWAEQLFKAAGTAVKPFEPTTSLVVKGPFAISRNPMYLGMLLILAGIAIALGSATPWLIVPLFAWQVSQRFIVPEERKLRDAFGARYAEYAARVRRWL